MTFMEVFSAVMSGNPVTRAEWIEDDENRIVFYDTEIKSFVERRTADQWEVQCKFLCVTHEDMLAGDWEICEWGDECTSITVT
jgi:hypothetical protein